MTEETAVAAAPEAETPAAPELTLEQIYQACLDDQAATPIDKLAQQLGLKGGGPLRRKLADYIIDQQQYGKDLLFPRLNVPISKPRPSNNVVRRTAADSKLQIGLPLLKDLGFEKAGSFEATREGEGDDARIVLKPVSWLADRPDPGPTIDTANLTTAQVINQIVAGPLQPSEPAPEPAKKRASAKKAEATVAVPETPVPAPEPAPTPAPAPISPTEDDDDDLLLAGLPGVAI